MNLELVTGGKKERFTEKEYQELKEKEEREELARKVLYNLLGGGPTPLEY